MIAAAFAVLVGAFPSPSLARQAAAEIVRATQQIPRGSYKTWSLFLVCNPDWATPERSADLANLYRRFRVFGDAIGRDNLAVWFWKRDTSITSPQLAENVDVARSVDYCRALKLQPSAGPFVVVTSAYPDVARFPDEHAVFELGGLAPKDLARLLNSLTDQLVLEGKVDAVRRTESPADSAAAAPPAGSPDVGLWLRLLEGTRRSIIGFGCALKLQIDAGAFKAELRSCTGP